jgi:hypothetical protein
MYRVMSPVFSRPFRITEFQAERAATHLWKAAVADDSGFNRPVTLNRRQLHLAHPGQPPPLVRPRRIADRMLGAVPSSLGCRRHRHRSTLLR